MNDENAVAIARLEERFAAQSKEMEAVVHEMAMMAAKLDLVLAALNEAKGGWKLMMAVGGAAAAAASGLAWAFSHVSIK